MRHIGQTTDQARGEKGRPQHELAATATSLFAWVTYVSRLHGGVLTSVQLYRGCSQPEIRMTWLVNTSPRL